MKLEEAILRLKQYQGYAPIDGNVSKHAFDLTDETVNVLLSALCSNHFRDVTKMIPLTLEQLREMEGQPVWIVESPDWGHWELSEDAGDYLCDRDTDMYGLTYPDPDGKAGLHKLGWFAYAYPPAHIDREAWEPCGIGDSVFHITTCKGFWRVLDGTMYGENGEHGTATGYYCPCELAENCPFQLEEDGSFDCEKHKNTEAIYEDVAVEIVVNEMESFVRLDYSGSVDFKDFGKTIFLTRESAAAALKGEQDGET